MLKSAQAMISFSSVSQARRGGVLLGFLVATVWGVWFALAGPDPLAHLLDHWRVALTMVFGSLIAGATSEGGGAVAFPVFTKLLHVPSLDAKQFSLAIQSVGMSGASLMIVGLGVVVEWRAVRWASLGGVPGVLVGLWLGGLLPPVLVKMAFTVLVGSFGLTLAILNCRRNVERYVSLCRFDGRERILLVLIGMGGGIMSGLVGNGIDIVVFSVLVLWFGVCEKVATPTSVVLMAINSLVGSAALLLTGRFTPCAEAYWLASVPVVAVGAPLGALLCARMNRTAVAWLLIFLIGVEVVTSLWIIPLDLEKGALSAALFLVFVAAYTLMYRSRLYR